MKLKGHLQVSGDISARNFSPDSDFYGITVKQTSDVQSFGDIKVLAFNDDSFYITQNDPNTDEAIINFRGVSTTSSGISSITISDGFNTQIDDTIHFSGNDFYISTNLSGEPVINSSQKSAVIMSLTTAQTINVSTGDHITWNSTRFKIGSNITPDTTSSYTTGPGASIGRWRLEPGHTYEMFLSVNLNFSGASGDVSVVLRDEFGNVLPGTGARAFTVTSVNTVNSNQMAIAMFTPDAPTYCEARFGTITELLSVGVNSFVRIVEL